MKVDITVTSSGRSGGWAAKWGIRDVRILAGTISNWAHQVTKSDPLSGVAIIIRRES